MLSQRPLASPPIALVLISILLQISCAHRSDEIVETWETSTPRYHVRVIAYKEKGGFLNGAYYVFSSQPAGKPWAEVFTFRHDDEVAIPKDQVRFVTGDIGLAFMGWIYAVTTDGGMTWSVWDAEKDWPSWRAPNYGLINAVALTPSGQGVMKLKFAAGRAELHTADYGKHWGPVPGITPR